MEQQQMFTEKPLQRFLMDVAFGLCMCLFVFLCYLAEVKKVEMEKANTSTTTTCTP